MKCSSMSNKQFEGFATQSIYLLQKLLKAFHHILV